MSSFLTQPPVLPWQVTLKPLPGRLGREKKLLVENLALRANHKQAKRQKVGHEVECKPREKRG
jgi:hypothetical protein